MGVAMTDPFFGITWDVRYVPWLLPLLVGGIGALFIYMKRAVMLVRGVTRPELEKQLYSHVSLTRLWTKTGCFFGALFFIALALLRPQWGVEEGVVTGKGRAVLIALDVSRSMCAQDTLPSRIVCAKNKIKEIVKALKADRVGLLIFSGDALLLCPLTTDYDAFSMFLDTVSIEAVSSGTTALAPALEKGMSAFGGQTKGMTRLVLLFTDGEDFSEHLDGIRGKVKDEGTHVCVLGLGSPEGAPVPLLNEQGIQTGFLKDNEGRVVVSRPNGQLMKELAHETNGLFVQCVPGDQDVARVVRWIDRFEKTTYAEHGREQKREQFMWYTAGALLLLLIEILL